MGDKGPLPRYRLFSCSSDAPTRATVAFVSEDGMTSIWEPTGTEQTQWQKVQTMQGPRGPLLPVLFPDDSRIFVAVSPDRIATVWKATEDA